MIKPLPSHVLVAALAAFGFVVAVLLVGSAADDGSKSVIAVLTEYAFR